MQARLTIKTIFKIDSLTTRYRLPAFTAEDHLFARTLDGTIAPQLIAAADTPSRSSDGQLRVFSMSLQDREIAVIIIVRIRLLHFKIKRHWAGDRNTCPMPFVYGGTAQCRSHLSFTSFGENFTGRNLSFPSQ